VKGFMTLVLLALLGLAAYNYWQIRTLREEVAQLQQKAKQRHRINATGNGDSGAVAGAQQVPFAKEAADALGELVHLNMVIQSGACLAAGDELAAGLQKQRTLFEKRLRARRCHGQAQAGQFSAAVRLSLVIFREQWGES